MTQHWADQIAEELIKRSPQQKIYVFAAGISPSGTVHIGNFRDLITPEVVARALQSKGKKVRLLFSWDDYDRFRKVPVNVPKTFEEYIGLPLSQVPDPFGKEESYARHFEKEFETSLIELDVDTEFRYQTKLYQSGVYNDSIVEAMSKRKAIAKILSEFKTQEVKEEDIESYYPLTVYCEQCGKDSTKILSYSDTSHELGYSCKCGHENTVDIAKKNIGKLQWKIDWPMRWRYEEVIFEPGGRDHSSPGGSYEVSSRIAKEIFNIEPPYYQPYDFIGLRGLAAKMSGSSGINVSPQELLEIYEPVLLRWLFLRVHPTKAFSLCFDSEIIRQYEEFDKEVELYLDGKLPPEQARVIELAITPKTKLKKNNIPFRQIASIGQIIQGNTKELERILTEMETNYNYESLERRLKLSQRWIEKYAPEMHVRLKDSPDIDYYQQLSDKEQRDIDRFFKEIDQHWTQEDLEHFVYAIPKDPNLAMEENKIRQRNFFKNIYQIIIGKDTGPRLATLLIAIGQKKLKSLSIPQKH
ncbi:MAG: lysine--tRNA ligase [bacterium]|nr:lysine--tRNA ligase [bacterium]